MGILPICMSVHHLDVWCLIRPEEGFRSLELELQMAVKHYVGAGTKPVLWNRGSASILDRCAIFPAHAHHFLCSKLLCLMLCFPFP